jgi:uncharacterized membrane protein YvlD (DUF360 family)
MSSLLTFFAVGLITLIVAGVALSIVGLVFSMALGRAGFLLFKVAPIIFVGWLVLKLLDRSGSSPGRQLRCGVDCPSGKPSLPGLTAL